MGLDVSHVIPNLNTSNRSLEYFSLKELTEYPDYIQRHVSLVVEREDKELGNYKVIYFTEVGFQRKGMNSKFYEDFENGKPYLDLASVKRAFQYLKADHISSLKELQENFQANFIDNFIEGESIFYASW